MPANNVVIEVSEELARLVRRVQQLTPGNHLVILDVSPEGLDSFTELSSGPKERLRKARPAPPAPPITSTPAKLS